MVNFGLDGVQWQDVKAVSVGSPKPYDAEVEYLESTGTQYIDTGMTINTTTDKVQVSCQMVGTTAWRYCFGIMQSGAYFAVGRDSTKTYALYASSATSKDLSLITGSRHEVVGDSTGLSIDNTGIYSYSSFASTAPIWLFSLNRPGNTNNYNSSTRIWGYKHWRNGVLVMDLQPCRLNGIGYLFDKVSGQLFGNQGTGVFLYGADVPDISSVVQAIRVADRVWYACPYAKDGLIAWFDGIWNAGVGIHDASATVWANLAGGVIQGIDVSGKASFGEDHASFIAGSTSSSTQHPVPDTTWHQEMVFDWSGMSNSDMYQPTIGANRVIFLRNYSANRVYQCSFAATDGNYEASGVDVNTARLSTISSTVHPDGVCAGMVAYMNGTKYNFTRSWTGTRTVSRTIQMRPNAAGTFKVFSFRLYNRVLTADEVAANHLVDKARFNLPA